MLIGLARTRLRRPNKAKPVSEEIAPRTKRLLFVGGILVLLIAVLELAELVYVFSR